MICRRSHTNMIVGAPCSDCGHSSLVHPGISNPAVEECALCRLEKIVRRLNKVVR